MKSTLLACRALVFTFMWMIDGHAVQIKLATPIKYRKEEYQEFDTRNALLPLLLQIIEERAQTEPLVVEQIKDAIAKQEHIKHPNMLYFNPPLDYNGELLYQRYPYTKDSETVQELRGILNAALASPHREHYAKQIDRINGILKHRRAFTDNREEGEEKPASRKRGRPRKIKKEEPTKSPNQKMKIDEGEDRQQDPPAVWEEQAPANNNVPREEQPAPIPPEPEIVFEPMLDELPELPPDLLIDWSFEGISLNTDPLM